MEIVSYWKIGLEIAILWYVIYLILLFVKGTRSEQLLKGLFIIGLIFVVTQQLRLDAINWALTRLFPLSVVALIVIFQPELRRGLAQLGQFGAHQEDTEVIDEIVTACVALSKKRTGALIVVEREAGLKSYIETGTVINGRVSNRLLASLFSQYAPLHDGAVIIGRGKILAAGCVLPLTQEEKDLQRPIGMRHRASIGITEETDAVCVVVSEETGALSVAEGGKLTHGLDEESLSRVLRSLLYDPAKEKAPFVLASHIRSMTGKKDR